MICFPLDNTPYEAKDMGAYLATRTRGVFSANANLAVSPGSSGLSVSVSPGLAWLKWSDYWGTAAMQEQAQTLTLDTADGALKRIDAIVCRLDKVGNKAEIVVKKGSFSSAPVIAAPVRDANYDEIYLATVLIGAGVTSITAAAVTDQRLNETYCGLMRDGVTGIPTAQLQAQAQELIEQLDALLQGVTDRTELMLKSVYAARIAHVGSPNLLDNSLWRANGDIVNQRGKTVYTDSSGVAMDRWNYTRCTVSLAARTVSVAPGAESDGYLYQRTDKAAVGDALTFTVRIAGQDFTASTVLAEGSALTAPLLCAAPWGGLKLYSASGVCTAMLYITKGQSIPFPEWLKLETGDVATPYTPKGFAAELSECMRYYQTIGFWLRCWADATGANCTLPLGLPMRAVPAASVSTGYTNNMASVNTVAGTTSVAVLLAPTANGMVHANGSVTLSADL